MHGGGYSIFSNNAAQVPTTSLSKTKESTWINMPFKIHLIDLVSMDMSLLILIIGVYSYLLGRIKRGRKLSIRKKVETDILLVERIDRDRKLFI